MKEEKIKIIGNVAYIMLYERKPIIFSNTRLKIP